MVEPAYDAYTGSDPLNSQALVINGIGTPMSLGKAVRKSGLWSGPRRASEQWGSTGAALTGMSREHGGPWSMWRVTWTNQHGGVTGGNNAARVGQGLAGSVTSGVLLSSRTCGSLPQHSAAAASSQGYGQQARWWAFEAEVQQPTNFFACTGPSGKLALVNGQAGPLGINSAGSIGSNRSSEHIGYTSWPHGVTASGGCGGMEYVPPDPHNSRPPYEGQIGLQRSGGGAPAYVLPALDAGPGNSPCALSDSAAPISLTAGSTAWTQGPLAGASWEPITCQACKDVNTLTGCNPKFAGCTAFPIALKHSFSNTIVVAGRQNGTNGFAADPGDWGGSGPSADILRNTDFIPQGIQASAGGSCPTWGGSRAGGDPKAPP